MGIWRRIRQVAQRVDQAAELAQEVTASRAADGTLKVGDLDQRLAGVVRLYAELDARLEALDRRLTELEQRIDGPR
ncbi:MAG: hypothetical protein IRY83_14995 [Chloroflexi bacterium]|nr:hypothetical protein [Chloroflexota bacterium]